LVDGHVDRSASIYLDDLVISVAIALGRAGEGRQRDRAS